MRLEKINNTSGGTIEVNLDNLATIDEQQYTNEVVLCFGGYFVTVNQDEYKRIKSLLEQPIELCEVCKTEDPLNKFKEIIYRATYLDSNAKLQLIMQLENIE